MTSGIQLVLGKVIIQILLLRVLQASPALFFLSSTALTGMEDFSPHILDLSKWDKTLWPYELTLPFSLSLHIISDTEHL